MYFAARTWSIAALFLILTPDLPARAELKYFQQLDQDVFVGSQPRSLEDFEELRSHGIKTIVSVRMQKWAIRDEKKQAEKLGFQFRSAPINGLYGFKPSKRSVNRVLGYITETDLHPVYMHCSLGRDRSGFVAALYRTYVNGWHPDDALEEWKSRGFIPFLFAGLYRYFRENTEDYRK